MLGFSFSALLKAAEEEVQAGLTGSKALTAAVLEAIKHLIQGVGSGDALAFVLPGLASGFSKILIVAGGFCLHLPHWIGGCLTSSPASVGEVLCSTLPDCRQTHVDRTISLL